MKTSRTSFSPREIRLARFFLVGFALSLAPLGAQTAPQPTTSGATTPGNTPSAVTTPQHANTSFYDTPNTGAATGVSGSTATAPAGTVKTGTVTPNVNTGGGSGSGQAGGSSSPSSP